MEKTRYTHSLLISFCLMLCWWFPTQLWASHNLAGQLTCRYIALNKYEITLTTYTDPAPMGVDRCYADIEIWNNSGVKLTTISSIPRSNGSNDVNCSVPNAHLGVPIYQTVKKNIYITNFTFPGSGLFLIRYFDPTRRSDIININNPGDVNFYVETTLFISNPLEGNNNTPILLNDPLDEACAGKVWTHNPGGFDLDGDSLVYKLTESRQYDPNNNINLPQAAAGYQFPDNSTFGSSSLTMDPTTGLITWNTPQQIGNYNIAYIVYEYRNGVLLGNVLRDMVIFVKPCNNNPPIIETISDTCVYAGDTLRFKFLVYEKDSLDSVYLALNNANVGANGPFSVANPATLQLTSPVSNSLPVGLQNPDSIKGEVIWGTLCDNIRYTKYQVDFYAHDNFGYFGAIGGLAMLTANKAVTIRVLPPPPTNLQVAKNSQQIQLSWTASACTNAVGYNIYRKISADTTDYQQDTICCDQSPSEAGFELIHYQTGWGNTTFTDSLQEMNTILGQSLCYVVTALFGPDYQPNVESCASNDACIKFRNDTLYLTNVSVNATDLSAGQMKVAWSQPDSIDDFFKAPYYYKVYRANNNQFPAIFITNKQWNDTVLIDNNLDTKSRGYNYRVEVYDADGRIVFNPANKNISSSIFLTAQSAPAVMNLEWKVFPTWQNQEYQIWRSENTNAPILVATIPATSANTYTYQDMGLTMNSLYCYFIRSVGSYPNIQGILNPLINESNQACAYPRVEVPPCNPNYSIKGDCVNLTHEIKITKITENCDDLIAEITLYFSNSYSGPYVPVKTISTTTFAAETTLTFNYANNPLYFAGCYAVTAKNVYNQTSELSEPQCIDFCPIIELSNVFTPNNDNFNDLFTPVRVRSVLLKEIQIFDRWGNMVHSSNADIEKLWDGKINGKDASEGVYYYYIRYDEQKLSGNVEQYQKGWVMLLR